MKKLLMVCAVAIAAIAVVPVATAATPPKVITIKVVNGRPVGGIVRPSVKRGTVVRFVVTTNKGSELHLHGYNIERVPKQGKAVIQFTAKIPGRFELELHDPDALLANLTVKP